MAVDDLLSEDDFFSENKEKSKEEAQTPSQDFPEDDLFSGMPAKEEEAPSAEESAAAEDRVEISEEPQQEEPQDFSKDVQDELELDEISDHGEDEKEEEAPAQGTGGELEYYDDKQEKISYKPFFVGTGIVALIIIIFAVLKFWVFTGDVNAPVAKTEEEKKAETEQVQKPSAEEIKRNAFYKTLKAKTSQSLGAVSGLASAVGKQNKLSSILLYGDEYLIEVFCKNRSELAKLNMDFKQNRPQQNLEIISSSPRPGSGGGILGLFRLKSEAPAGGAEAAQQDAVTPFKDSREAVGWLNFLAENNALFIKKSKTRSLSPSDGFSIYELEASITGDVKNCLNLVDAIASGGKNIEVRKLNLTAVDQRKFNPKKYQLRIILRIYV